MKKEYSSRELFLCVRLLRCCTKVGEGMSAEKLNTPYNDELYDAIVSTDSVNLCERYKSGQISATEALQRMDELFKLMEQ